ncbi:hypothetical protein QN345_18190, partial [Cryobacterium sp. 10I1]|uniref:hypothetical protein n=1 Tax=Cryobacterium sp. 10I1 TaxID=3048578 RepID=UPI002B22F42C
MSPATPAAPASPPARRVRWGLDDAAAGAVGAILLVLAADWALSPAHTAARSADATGRENRYPC